MASVYVRAFSTFLIISCVIHVASSQSGLGMLIAKEVAKGFVKEGVNLLMKNIFPKLATLIGIPVPDDDAKIISYINSSTNIILKKLEEMHTDLKNEALINGIQSELIKTSISIKVVMESLIQNTGYNDSVSDRQFIELFQQGNVKINTETLVELFTTDYYLDRPDIISLILGQNQCNINRTTFFFDHYASLVSYGILAEIQYTSIFFNGSELQLSHITDKGKQMGDKMSNVFIAAIDKCKEKWNSFATQDLRNAYSPDALWVLNNKWTPWLNNDVIFSSGRGTNRFAYRSTERRSVLKNNLRFSIFYNNQTVEYVKQKGFITENRSSYRNSITGPNDHFAAKHVADAVIGYLSDKDYEYENIIVLFDKGGEVTEHLTQGSPVFRFPLETIELVDQTTQKSVTGTFKVYVYLRNQMTGSDGKEGYEQEVDSVDSGFQLSCNTSLIALLALIALWK